MKVLSKVVLTALSIVLLSGCGGGDSSGSEPVADTTTPTDTTATLKGTFVDAPVQGLAYKTTTQNGFTDASGQFKYVNGEKIEFKLGNLSLGKGTAGALVTPYIISSNDNIATNIALLLQNFDNDRTDGVLNVSALKDYNFSNFNISDTSVNLETKLTTLLATGSFQILRGGSEFDLLDSMTVKKNMDTYLVTNSIKESKQFTQAFLDNTIFYKSGNEYPQYKNKYVDGKIYFAGDEENSEGWDSEFPAESSNAYVLEDGILKASFENGDEVAVEILSVTDSRIEVQEVHAVHGSRTSMWYITKEAAVNNLISQALNKIGDVYFLENGEYNQSPYTAEFTESNMNVVENGDTTSLPSSIIDGIIKVDWSRMNDPDEYHTIISVDSQYIYGCLSDTLAYAKVCYSATYRIKY